MTGSVVITGVQRFFQFSPSSRALSETCKKIVPAIFIETIYFCDKKGKKTTNYSETCKKIVPAIFIDLTFQSQAPTLFRIFESRGFAEAVSEKRLDHLESFNFVEKLNISRSRVVIPLNNLLFFYPFCHKNRQFCGFFTVFAEQLNTVYRFFARSQSFLF